MSRAEIAAQPNFHETVKWDHAAAPGSNELKVTKGDEVIIITSQRESDGTGWYKVKHTVTGDIGNIPERCFYRRRRVNSGFTGQETGELSVDEDEIVGIIKEDTEDHMCWVMKENGTSGKIPVGCFSASYRAEIVARHNYPGGLKFVRWDHTAKPGSNELTVKIGDEVIIITRPKEERGWYEVKHTVTRKIGNIPKRCFYTRMKVNFGFTGQETGQLSVDKDEIVGIINEDTEDDMWLVMKDNETTGKIPVKCFYPPYEAYRNHIAAESGELSVNKGDNIGIIDVNRSDGYWMGYFRGRTGLVPSKCFELPIKGDVDNRALNYPLASQDSEDVLDCIKNLEAGQIIALGQSLGLSYETLTSVKCGDIPSRMVTAWLSKKDKVVETSGNPSWKSLKDALLKMRVTDVANMIMKGIYMQYQPKVWND